MKRSSFNGQQVRLALMKYVWLAQSLPKAENHYIVACNLNFLAQIFIYGSFLFWFVKVFI